MAVRKRKVNGQRGIESEIRSDSQAKNQLAVSSTNYANANGDQKKLKNRVYKKTQTNAKVKKQRVYTEKELGIPKLNMAIDPEGVLKIRGKKKGKVFAQDSDSLMRILADVSEKVDSQQASKLDKAQQLEAIRDAKRKEIEKREQDKEDLIKAKKDELKKRKRKSKSTENPENDSSKKTKKRVSFA